MTQTMREQLQALVKDIKFIRNMNVMLDRRRILMELESILATPDPAVTVRKGWVCKDRCAVRWSSKQPEWAVRSELWITPAGSISVHVEDFLNDPWPDKPDGGPECVIEVG